MTIIFSWALFLFFVVSVSFSLVVLFRLTINYAIFIWEKRAIALEKIEQERLKTALLEMKVMNEQFKIPVNNPSVSERQEK